MDLRTKFFSLSLVLFFSVSCLENKEPSDISRAKEPLRKVQNEDREIRYLKTKKIKLGDHVLEVEIADNPRDSSRGLMYRTELQDGKGMLFIFETERILSFWMKNTYIPLSIGYFNKDKVLINIEQMEPMKSEMQTDFPNYKSEAPAKFALEVPKDWFKKHGIKPGMKFSEVSK